MLPIIWFLMAFFSLPHFFPERGEKLDCNVRPFTESKFLCEGKTFVHYRTWNADHSKGTVCLISGFGGSTYSWRKNVPFLVKNGYSVITIDPPPFGYSSKESGLNHSMSATATLVWKIIDAEKRENVILLGHSMGAAITAAMADSLPERVLKSVYIDGGPYRKRVSIGLLRNSTVQKWADLIARNCVYRHEVFEKITLSAYSEKPDSFTVNEFLKPFLYKNSAGGVLDLAASKEVRIISGKYREVPSLVIWGGRDHWLPEQLADHVVNRLDNADYILLKDGGHCPMETHPEEFNEVLIDFLE